MNLFMPEPSFREDVMKTNAAKRFFLSGLLTAMVCLACGCYTQTPYPVTYEYSTQQKMQAAYHWDILASDVAKQVRMRLAQGNMLDRSVYVEPPCGAPFSKCETHRESPFGQAFHDLLLTELYNQGIRAIPEIEDGALMVSHKVQVVCHKENRRTRVGPPGMLTTMATILTGAVAVARGVYDHGNTEAELGAGAAGAIGAAALVDVTSGMFVKGLPHMEVIITTSIKNYNTFMMRRSDIYYINDVDYWHYVNPPAPEKIAVSGS